MGKYPSMGTWFFMSTYFINQSTQVHTSTFLITFTQT